MIINNNNNMLSVDQSLSLFIPKVSFKITSEVIARVFWERGVGLVKNVDFVSKTDFKGNYYNHAYIHFEYWFDHHSNIDFQTSIVNLNQHTRIIYDRFNHYWNILPNKTSKYNPNYHKPTIDLTTSTSTSDLTSHNVTPISLPNHDEIITIISDNTTESYEYSDFDDFDDFDYEESEESQSQSQSQSQSIKQVEQKYEKQLNIMKNDLTTYKNLLNIVRNNYSKNMTIEEEHLEKNIPETSYNNMIRPSSLYERCYNSASLCGNE